MATVFQTSSRWALSASYSEQVGVSLGNGDGTFKAPVLTNYSAQYLNNSQGGCGRRLSMATVPDVAITDPFDPTGSGIFALVTVTALCKPVAGAAGTYPVTITATGGSTTHTWRELYAHRQLARRVRIQSVPGPW